MCFLNWRSELLQLRPKDLSLWPQLPYKREDYFISKGWGRMLPPPNPSTKVWVHQQSVPVWINREGSPTYNLKRLFPRSYPEVSVKSINDCLLLPWWQRQWAGHLVLHRVVNGLGPVFLTRHPTSSRFVTYSFRWAPASQNRIRLNFHNKEETFPSSPEALLDDKFCSVSENFPLMHLGFDKDRDSLVSPALLCTIPLPSPIFIILEAEVAFIDVV